MRHLPLEVLREIGPVSKVEVHGEKSHVARHIDETKPVIEFDAVVNRQCARGEVDVFEVQIAVSVANPPLAHASLEPTRVPLEKLIRVCLDRCRCAGRNCSSDKTPRLREVLI